MVPTVVMLCAAALIGAMAQRSTGIGFSLIVTPVCAVALLPDDAIGTVVRLALIADIVVLVSERSSIDWRAARRLLVPTAIAVPFGFAVGELVSSRALVFAASFATLAVSIHMLNQRRRPSPAAEQSAETPVSAPAAATPADRAAGFAAGFMGVTTGMAGPPLALHASSTGRPPASNRASMMILFVLVDLAATFAHPRSLGPDKLGVITVAIVVGMFAGVWVTGRVSEHRLRTCVLAVVVASATAGLLSVIS